MQLVHKRPHFGRVVKTTPIQVEDKREWALFTRQDGIMRTRGIKRQSQLFVHCLFFFLHLTTFCYNILLDFQHTSSSSKPNTVLFNMNCGNDACTCSGCSKLQQSGRSSTPMVLGASLDCYTLHRLCQSVLCPPLLCSRHFASLTLNHPLL